MKRDTFTAWGPILDSPCLAAFGPPPPPLRLVLLAAAFLLIAGFARAQTPGTWQSRDINAGQVGVTEVTGGTVVLRGAGADIWDTADSFRFHGQLVTGDVTLIARVSSVDHTDDWAKAGLMIRDSLDPTARNIFVGLTPTWHGGVLQTRTDEGGLTQSGTGPDAGVPSWLRLNRRGTEITVATSADGTTWTPLNLPQAVSLNAEAYIGLAVSSHDPATLGAATFEQVDLTTSAPPGPPPPPAAEWAGRDIGAVGATGSSIETGGGGMTVTGSGDDIYDHADAFQFYARPLTGDGEIVARVTSIEHTHDWAKAGLMMRASNDPSAPMAFIGVNADFAMITELRRWPRSGTGSTNNSSGSAPGWLKVVRAGDTFATYYSQDGSSWVMGLAASIEMPATILVGLATTSHAAGTLCPATFDQISVRDNTVEPPPPGASIAPPANLGATAISASSVQLQWTDQADNESGFAIERSADGEVFAQIALVGANATGYLDQGLSALHVYWYRVRAWNPTLTSPYSNTATVALPDNASAWAHREIGHQGVPGSFTAHNDQVSLSGSGEDIWGNSDGFHFVYQSFGGDFEFQARIDSLENTDPWAKAGLMIRESLEPGARHALIGVTPGNGVGMFFRQNPDGETSLTPGPWGAAAPTWVRMIRSGQLITTSSSTDGIHWQVIATHGISLGESAYVGLAVTSHSPSTLSSASFSSVLLQSANPL